MGTLTTGKELRLAVVVWAIMGDEDTIALTLYDPTLKLSPVLSSLCLPYEPVDLSSTEPFYTPLLLVYVPREKRSEPGFDPLLWLSMSFVLA